jgi:hypothetical protein
VPVDVGVVVPPVAVMAVAPPVLVAPPGLVAPPALVTPPVLVTPPALVAPPVPPVVDGALLPQPWVHKTCAKSATVPT